MRLLPRIQPPQEGHDLCSRAAAAGAEGGARCAVGDAVVRGPLHRFGVVGVGGHVAEGRRAVCGRLGRPEQEGHALGDPENPPTTLDELREAAIACTDPSKNQYGLGLPTDYGYYCEYLWANGGDVINEDATQNLLNSEENIATLEWIQKLATEDGVSPEGLTAADADTMFQSGQLAMYTSGPWNINGLTQLGLNYGITAIPGGSDGAYSPEGGCSYMLTKGADEQTKEAVYKFMAYWLSDDVLKEWSNRNGFPVWSYSVLENADIQNNEILSAVSKASEIGRDWHLGLECGSMIDNDVMKPMMEKILSGADVTQSVQEASDALDAVISD